MFWVHLHIVWFLNKVCSLMCTYIKHVKVPLKLFKRVLQCLNEENKLVYVGWKK